MALVYIGIGSNLGDRRENIGRALTELSEVGVIVRKQATLIETEPVGGPPQGPYLNGVWEAETELSPRALLAVLKNVERLVGRKVTVRNGPREIDLDILLYDEIILNAPDLTIPHPRMREREFVMQPLREIAPQVAERIAGASD